MSHRHAFSYEAWKAPCAFCRDRSNLKGILAGSPQEHEQVTATITGGDVYEREHHLCGMCAAGVLSLQRALEKGLNQ